MKPALSIVFFTVSSGAGLGLLALLSLADLFLSGGGLDRGQSLLAAGLGCALVIAFFPDALLGAALACLAGLSAERWLFFALARHTVLLYHGAQRA